MMWRTMGGWCGGTSNLLFRAEGPDNNIEVEACVRVYLLSQWLISVRMHTILCLGFVLACVRIQIFAIGSFTHCIRGHGHGRLKQQRRRRAHTHREAWRRHYYMIRMANGNQNWQNDE